MASETVHLERLGDTVDEVVVLEWLVAPGDVVHAGAPLVRVETDKVEVEIASPHAGTVSDLLVAVDDEIATGTPLCTITVNSA